MRKQQSKKNRYIIDLIGFTAALAAIITWAVLYHQSSTWNLIFETPWLLGIPPFLWGAYALICLGVIYLIYLAADTLIAARKLRKNRGRCEKE